jgi:hypothetical protein
VGLLDELHLLFILSLFFSLRFGFDLLSLLADQINLLVNILKRDLFVLDLVPVGRIVIRDPLILRHDIERDMVALHLLPINYRVVDHQKGVELFLTLSGCLFSELFQNVLDPYFLMLQLPFLPSQRHLLLLRELFT